MKPSANPNTIGVRTASQTIVGAEPLLGVPMLDLHRQFEQIGAHVIEEIRRVCASQHYILGPEVEAFERDIAEFCGARHGVGCASGTDALWLALLASGVSAGDQVLTTPFSFFASASAIARTGARPVFADIDPATFNLDPAHVESVLRDSTTRKLKALLPVHLYGQCADMDAFKKLAEDFRLRLIEDAAQAIGAHWRDQRAGALGDSAAFSFYPTKNLSAYGDAGLVATNNSDTAEHMRRLRNHGSPRRYLHEEFGANSRLDAIQAAVLRVKLKYVESWNDARRERAAIYDRLLNQAGLAKAARPKAPKEPVPAEQGKFIVSKEVPLALPQQSPHAHHIFHQYVIRAHRRDELRDFLSSRKIGSEIYYPTPLHLQPCFAYLGYVEGDLPEAERASKEVLALPMFPELREDEQRTVVDAIADFYS